MDDTEFDRAMRNIGTVIAMLALIAAAIYIATHPWSWGSAVVVAVAVGLAYDITRWWPG